MNIEGIWRYVLTALISSIGGLGQLAMKKNKGLFTPFLLFCELFAAAICGCLVLPLANIIGLNKDWVILFSFCAGLSSPWIAKKATGLFKKQMNASIGGLDPTGANEKPKADSEGSEKSDD